MWGLGWNDDVDEEKECSLHANITMSYDGPRVLASTQALRPTALCIDPHYHPGCDK